MRRMHEIWMEGFAATGQHGSAHKIGEGEGRNFDEAVKDYMAKTPNHGIKPNDRRGYATEAAWLDRQSNWNIWGCNLFDNEKEARKSFG